MKTKLKLRLGLLIYCAALVFVPEASIYAVCINGFSVFVTIASNVFFILFLQSRKPAEKTVINRLLLLNFCFKLLCCLYFYSMTCIAYSFQTHQSNLEKVLSSTIHSHISVEILSTVGVMFYIFISLSRTFLFVSPAAFRSLNVKIVQWFAIAILLAYFVTETVYYQVIFPSSQCEVDQRGNGIHAFAFEVFWKTREQIAEGLTKQCYVIYAIMPLCVILLAMECFRVIAATVRELKKSRKKARVSPDLPEVGVSYTKGIKRQPADQAQSIKKTSRSNSVPVSTIKSDQVRRLSLQLLHMRKEEDLKMIKLKLETNHASKLKETSTMRILLDFISSLVRRTYSLAVFFLALMGFCYILPISFLGLDRKEIMYKVGKLDVFFVPVFWLLLDKDVWLFTKKNLEKSFLSLKIWFSN